MVCTRCVTAFSFSLSTGVALHWCTCSSNPFLLCPSFFLVCRLPLVGLELPNLPCPPQSDMAVPTASTITKTRDRLKGSGSDKSEWVTSFGYQLKVLLQRQSRQSRGEVSISLISRHNTKGGGEHQGTNLPGLSPMSVLVDLDTMTSVL